MAVLQQMGQPVVLCRVDGIDQRLGGLLHLGDGPALFILPGLDRGAPFLVYRYSKADNFAADGVAYFKQDVLHILMETTDANIVLLENAASETGKFALRGARGEKERVLPPPRLAWPFSSRWVSR